MVKLIVALLMIPLIIVIAAKNPQGVGHFLEVTFTVGAKLLNTIANILGALMKAHPHH